MVTHTCIILNTDTTYTVEQIDHKKIDEMCGGFTFVGAIPQFNVIAVASQQPENEDSNNYCKHSEYFDVPVKGTVILIGSDEDGEAMDLIPEPILQFLNSS